MEPGYGEGGFSRENQISPKELVFCLAPNSAQESQLVGSKGDKNHFIPQIRSIRYDH
jgi:hypothetical protein